jgi:hypothetical protein
MTYLRTHLLPVILWISGTTSTTQPPAPSAELARALVSNDLQAVRAAVADRYEPVPKNKPLRTPDEARRGLTSLDARTVCLCSSGS